jgi:hypothetical protein
VYLIFAHPLEANKKIKALGKEKLLLKLDWSKVEWNLKESLNEANKKIKALEEKSE